MTKGNAFPLRELLSDKNLSLITGDYSGGQSFSSGMPTRKTRSIYMTETTNGFVRLAVDDSSCRTWNACFHYRAYIPCVFSGKWTRNQPRHSRVSPSEGSSTVQLSLSTTTSIINLILGSVRQEL